MKSQIVFAGSPRYPEDEASPKKRDNDKHVNNAKKLGVRKSQVLYKAEDPYERCGYDGCDHPRANHAVASPSGKTFCVECRQTRPGAISSDVVHDFESKGGITGSAGPSHHLNPVPISRTRVAHPNRSEVRMHHENLLTGLEEMRSRFYGSARDKTEKSQRVYDPQPKRKLPQLNIGGDVTPRRKVRSQAIAWDDVRDRGKASDPGDFAYKPRVSGKPWRR